MPPAPSCICGDCRKCKHRAYMNSYYRKPGNAAKVCETARRSRARNVGRVRAYDRDRGFRVYDELKTAARVAVFRAIRRGELVREPCEKCGVEPADAHHDDYSKQLDVRWLCRTHHGIEHRTVAA